MIQWTTKFLQNFSDFNSKAVHLICIAVVEPYSLVAVLKLMLFIYYISRKKKNLSNLKARKDK